MAIEIIPEWMGELEEEDLAFIRRFLLASGSLKEMCYLSHGTTAAGSTDPKNPDQRAHRGRAVYRADQTPDGE